jgi:hypothetical protein
VGRPQLERGPVSVILQLKLDEPQITVRAQCSAGGRSGSAAASGRFEIGPNTLTILDDDEETITF